MGREFRGSMGLRVMGGVGVLGLRMGSIGGGGLRVS